jgi:hypothetical protein
MQATRYPICMRGCVTERLGSALEGTRLETGATATSLVKPAAGLSFPDCGY